MSSKRNISILVGIIGILILLLTASLGYIFANNDNWSEKIKSDKNTKVLKEINELKSLYDAKIADKTNSYMILQLQKDSIQNLVLALENSKTNEESLLKYKIEYKNLEGKMWVLVNEIDRLKSNKIKVVHKKEALVAENSVTKSKFVTKKNSSISKNKQAVKQVAFAEETTQVSLDKSVKQITETPVFKTKKNSKIVISNVKAQAFTSKPANKKIETMYASSTDLIKISLTLNENPDAESGEKTYYFQVINSSNNVIGKRITEYFDNESLTYSFSKSFIYDNQNLQISHDFIASEFEKGYYFINIFDRDQLIGKTSILLK